MNCQVNFSWFQNGIGKNETKRNIIEKKVDSYIYLCPKLKLGLYNQAWDVKWTFYLWVLPLLTYGAEVLTLKKASKNMVRVAQRAKERSMIGISLRAKLKKSTNKSRWYHTDWINNGTIHRQTIHILSTLRHLVGVCLYIKRSTVIRWNSYRSSLLGCENKNQGFIRMPEVNYLQWIFHTHTTINFVTTTTR